MLLVELYNHFNFKDVHPKDYEEAKQLIRLLWDHYTLIESDASELGKFLAYQRSMYYTQRLQLLGVRVTQLTW